MNIGVEASRISYEGPGGLVVVPSWELPNQFLLQRTMGRPPVVVETSPATTSTSWVDYWIDNTNYCVYFGCDDENYDNSMSGANGCCVGSNFLSHLDPSNSNRRNTILSSDGFTAMSESLRSSSAGGFNAGANNEDFSNFAAQHDAFLDSLLREQQQQILNRSSPQPMYAAESSTASPLDENALLHTSGDSLNTSSMTIATTHSWTLSPTSSYDSLSDNTFDNTRSKSSGGITRKRRRGLLLVATPRIQQNSLSSNTAATSSASLPPLDRTSLTTSTSNAENKSLPPLHSNSSGNLNPAIKQSSKNPATNGGKNAIETQQSPESFLHPAVRLQKDKGKGSDVGSDICAKGIPACIGKLRQKMQLLTEHCCVHPNQNGGTPTIATTSGAVASMKRRNAIIAERHANFVETRSLLTLRMGFLSMTYGILLRWDIGKTGLVTVVVLRKNCHESFYRRKLTSPPLLTKSMSAPTNLKRSPTLDSVSPVTSKDEDDDNDDIVRLNRPPYKVPRPTQFPPSEINVSVLYATGLNKKSHWTVQLQLGDQIENILLSYDGTAMVPKLGGPLHYVIPSSTVKNGNGSKNSQLHPPIIASGNMDAVLEIRLLEHKVRRKTRVLRCSMVLPLYSLEAVGSSSNNSNAGSTTTPTSTQLRIPCPDGAAIQLEATLVSDEAIWQREELAARQNVPEHGSGSRWKENSGNKQPPKSPKSVIHNDLSDKENTPWDWLFCSLC